MKKGDITKSLDAYSKKEGNEAKQSDNNIDFIIRAVCKIRDVRRFDRYGFYEDNLPYLIIDGQLRIPGDPNHPDLEFVACINEKRYVVYTKNDKVKPEYLAQSNDPRIPGNIRSRCPPRFLMEPILDGELLEPYVGGHLFAVSKNHQIFTKKITEIKKL